MPLVIMGIAGSGFNILTIEHNHLSIIGLFISIILTVLGFMVMGDNTTED